MYHLVSSHLTGEYYISTQDPKIIEAVCEQCGDYDSIILSYNEGMKTEALKAYFSKNIRPTKYLKEVVKYYDNIDDFLEELDYSYDDDKYMVKTLFKEKLINREEKKILFSQINQTHKKQLAMLQDVMALKDVKVLEKKKK